MNTQSPQTVALLKRFGLEGHIVTSPAAVQRLNELLSDRDTFPDTDYFQRKDLRHLSCYAIDGPNTDYIDDAFSFEKESGKVLVHIADPTRFFPKAGNDAVVQEALSKVATVYTTGTNHNNITMFPNFFTERYISLDGVKTDGHALTFGFKICDDGSIDVTSMTIESTFISRPRRMTYRIADHAIMTGMSKDLRHVYQLAFQRRMYRQKRGGAVTPENQERFLEKENSTSRVMVTEIMLTTGVVAAQYANRNKVPVPYRGQNCIGKQLGKKELSLRPIRHAGLGLDEYCQVTSPIRRSVDLLAHFQIKASLRKEKLPFRERHLKAEITRAGDVCRKIGLFDKEVRAISRRESFAGMPNRRMSSSFSKPRTASNITGQDFAACRKGQGAGVRKNRRRQSCVG